ncbi:hypothetical protein SAMN05421547_113138 [Delftia lacustris]|uniref:Uncharacterized protein n=2 Tax=Delftia lacustris TaxID=558537 RepID=A0A1H3QT31_9BURK|nr:hypothetical protein SAMN05421547_113138 [Delftia lacustris]
MDSEKPKHDASDTGAITSLAQLQAALQKHTVPLAVDQTKGVADVLRDDAATRLPDLFTAAYPSESHRAAYEEALKGAFATFDQRKTVSEFITRQFDTDESRRKALKSLSDPLNLKSAAATAFQTSLPGFDPAETFEKKAAALYEAQHGLENLGRVATGNTPKDAAAMFGLRPEDHAALTADELLRSSNWAAGHGAGIAPSEWADAITGAALSKNAADIFNDQHLNSPEAIQKAADQMLSAITDVPALDSKEFQVKREADFIQQQMDHAKYVEETIHKPQRERVRREQEQLALLRRSVEISEEQVAEAKADASKAQSNVRISLWIAFASLLVSAWQFLKDYF